MKLVLLEEAQRRFEAEDAWWRENRDTKELFVEEFEAAFKRLTFNPEAGQHYRQARGKLIQRVLMTKTRCHVYFCHDADRGVIEIHSIWGAHRGRGPAL